MECIVLLQLAAEPRDLRWFLFCRKSGQAEAVGHERMAPPKIPCGGTPSIYWAWGRWGAVSCPGTSHRAISLRLLSYRAGLQSGCKGSGKFKQGKGSSCWVVGWWGVVKGKEEPEGLGKDRRTYRDGAERWERPARAERMERVWVVSSSLGRGEGYRKAEREGDSVWPGSCFLKLFFIIPVLQYSLHPPTANFFFW